MFVTVAVNIPSQKTFSYAVPPALHKEIAVGKRVLIPFGKRRLTGYIIEVAHSTTCDDIKEIIEILMKRTWDFIDGYPNTTSILSVRP
jgi:primosomal protein N' (replication factor Y)